MYITRAPAHIMVCCICHLAGMAGAQVPADLVDPGQGFCVINQSPAAHMFSVDGGDAGSLTRNLDPGQALCLGSTDRPVSGFVSVFDDAGTQQPCTRPATTGTAEILLAYQDSDHCAWASGG